MNIKQFIVGGSIGLVIGLAIGFLLYPAVFGGYGRGDWDRGDRFPMMGGMGMMGMQSGGMMGGDIDRGFIEQMIPHHQSAIMMAEMLKRSTERPEMAKLADDIIEAQSREIDMMRGWYTSWYGEAPGSR